MFNDVVLLSHSRYIAPATQPVRFYREYFQPNSERTLEKVRRRWRILYKGVLFFINLDKLVQPAMPDLYIEVKARTWSMSDAELKANLIQEILSILGVDGQHAVQQDYLEFEA